MAPSTDLFSAKLGLVMDQLNLSRVGLARELAVDKTVVGRWLTGVNRPTGHNLTRLTDIVRRRVPGFTLAHWRGPIDSVAAAIGAAAPIASADNGVTPTLTRLAALGTLSRSAGEGLSDGASSPSPAPRERERPTPRVWEGEGSPTAPTLPDKPSIAVLPFTNMSSDPEQEFFADGIAEDIITALSRYPSLFVIARNSSFIYKSRAFDVTQVGQELVVRYVLEGSLRKSGSRVRITAQLVEVGTGNHLWAQRYDREFADIFTVQDEITEAVTVAVAPAIAEAELHRAMRKPPDSIDAWTAYQRGLWYFDKATVGDNAQAEALFQQAVDLDPNFADAYCGLAHAKLRFASVYQGCSLAEARNAAEPFARLAVALDSTNAAAHACLSMAVFLNGDRQGALVEAERALSLNSNLASGYWQRGLTLIFSGTPQEGVRDIQTSLRLEPRGLDLAQRWEILAVGYYFAREYENSIKAAREVIRLFPDYPLPRRWLTAALGQLNRTEEARAALEQTIAAEPTSFDFFVLQRAPWFRPEDHEHMLDGLRKAGWEG